MKAWRRLRYELDHYRRSLVLLIDRRAGLVVVVDSIVLLSLLVAALASEEGGSPRAVYQLAVVLPMILLGVPLLSDVVALERRAGSLDLTLTVPASNTCFVRRTAPICILLAAQGGLIMVVEALFVITPFPLLLVVIQTTLVSTLIGAISLFWAIRLKSAGSVAFATLLSICALGRWLLWNPVPDPSQVVSNGLILSLRDSWDWASNNFILATTAGLLYLDIRRRLNRPESLVA